MALNAYTTLRIPVAAGRAPGPFRPIRAGVNQG